MKKIAKTVVFVAALLMAFGFAQRVLRIDEVAVGQLDPGKATDYADSILMFNVYDTLVWADNKGRITPHLAERWAISSDKLTYTFNLRRSVKFHDGAELTADDVAFSLERMNGLNLGFAYLFKAWVKSARAVDKYTVSFTLTEPYAPFLAALIRLPIVNQALVLKNKKDGKFGPNGDYGEAFLGNNDAGSGPYSVVSHNPQELTVMNKFKDYFLGHAAKAPDVVRLRYGIEAATMRTLMARDEHEVTSQWLPPEVQRALLQSGKGVVQEGGSTLFFLKFNTKKAPTDDVNLRRAMALAFDYGALMEILKVDAKVSLGKPMRGPLPDGFPGADDTIALPKRDLNAAKAELAKSKADLSKPFEIGWVAEVPLEEKIALLFQQNMSEIGLKVNVVKIPWTLMTERAAKSDTTPNVSSIYVALNFPDADSLLYSMYHSKAAGTWMTTEWLQDKQVDTWLEDARNESDPAKREAIYSRILKRLSDLQPSIWAYESQGAFIKQPYLKVPTLEDPSKKVAGVMAGNWQFRLMEVDK